MTQTVCLFGAGGHAKVVIDALRTADSIDLTLFDDDVKKYKQDWLGVPVLGGRVDLFKKIEAGAAKVIVTIGDNTIRAKVYMAFAAQQLAFTTAIHARAILANSVTVGVGTMVMASVVINPDTEIGNNIIINTGAIIEHDVVIHDHAHIAPNTTICGGVSVGEYTLIGAGAVVLPGVQIGKNCIIGAGAVITNNVADGNVMAGVPAVKRN